MSDIRKMFGLIKTDTGDIVFAPPLTPADYLSRITKLESDNAALRSEIDALKNPWIKVSERFPEEHVMVLILTVDNEIMQRQLDYTLSDLSAWSWCDDNLQYSFPGWLVTHWSPLPQPPESGAQEGKSDR